MQFKYITEKLISVGEDDLDEMISLEMFNRTHMRGTQITVWEWIHAAFDHAAILDHFGHP